MNVTDVLLRSQAIYKKSVAGGGMRRVGGASKTGGQALTGS